MKRDVYVNDRIRAKTVRLVDEAGKQMGVYQLREVLNSAKHQGMDVVQMSQGDVPVVRIMDAGKFLFEKKKQERELARRQRELSVEVKEVQLRPGTDDNDLMVKAKRARGFLDEGNKVKVVVRFRGRERAHKDQGHKAVAQFCDMVGEHKIEKPVTDGGRDLQLILAPVKSKADLYREKNS